MAYNHGIYGPLKSDAFSVYEAMGIDAVFSDVEVSPEGKGAIKLAKDRGLNVYACTWTFKAPSKDEEKYGVLNACENKRLWVDCGCPNNPAIRENNLRWIEEVLTSLEIDGIVLDGARFPSPGSGLEAFLSCFCEYCRGKAKNYSLDILSIKEYLRNFRDARDFIRSSMNFPNFGDEKIMEWMNFRCKCITEHIENVAEIVKNSGAEIGAAVFAPSLAHLVGQKFEDLCRFLDFIQPMVYHKGSGIACLNYEVAKLILDCFKDENERAAAFRDIQAQLTYGGKPPRTIEELLEKGFPTLVIEKEIARAKELVKNYRGRLTPIIFIMASTLAEIEEIAGRALSSKPDGIVYFAYNKELSESMKHK